MAQDLEEEVRGGVVRGGGDQLAPPCVWSSPVLHLGVESYVTDVSKVGSRRLSHQRHQEASGVPEGGEPVRARRIRGAAPPQVGGEKLRPPLQPGQVGELEERVGRNAAESDATPQPPEERGGLAEEMLALRLEERQQQSVRSSCRSRCRLEAVLQNLKSL